MSPLCFPPSLHEICANSCSQCVQCMLQLLQESSDVNQTSLVHWLLFFFTFHSSEAALFPLPEAMTVIRVNRASGPGGFPPCVPGQAAETSCLMITLSLPWRIGWCSGRMSLSCGPLSAPSHGGGTAGLVASGSCVCWWRAPLSLRSSPCLDQLLPAADSCWQACSSSCVLTWTHCPALSVMNGQ